MRELSRLNIIVMEVHSLPISWCHSLNSHLPSLFCPPLRPCIAPQGVSRFAITSINARGPFPVATVAQLDSIMTGDDSRTRLWAQAF